MLHNMHFIILWGAPHAHLYVFCSNRSFYVTSSNVRQCDFIYARAYKRCRCDRTTQATHPPQNIIFFLSKLASITVHSQGTVLKPTLNWKSLFKCSVLQKVRYLHKFMLREVRVLQSSSQTLREFADKQLSVQSDSFKIIFPPLESLKARDIIPCNNICPNNSNYELKVQRQRGTS